jgi:hypothetical protein
VLAGLHRADQENIVVYHVAEPRWALFLITEFGFNKVGDILMLLSPQRDRTAPLLIRWPKGSREESDFDWDKAPKDLRLAVDCRPENLSGVAESTDNMRAAAEGNTDGPFNFQRGAWRAEWAPKSRVIEF